MGEALVARYWCHMCSQMVSPVMEVEMKCPFCDSGFVEEVEGRGDFDSAEMVSDRSISLLAPLLLGMMGVGGPSRRHRPMRDGGDDDDSDQDRNLTSLLRRRRRRSSAIFRLIQDLEDRIQADPDSMDGERERERDRDRESLILIDNFNRALILQGSFDNHGQGQDSDGGGGGFGASLGDYFLGPGLDLLLQHLAENDPNRYGTPPAKKEAVEALPTVKIQENTSCSVCLEDLEIGAEVREMPCKHSFHNGCLVPWLELHSSCPVCRFQLPSDEPKDSSTPGGNGRDGDRGSENRNLSSNEWDALFPFWENSGSNSAYNPSSSSSGGNADEN
ncbi:E3 ubiquitin-protein ligase SIRP1-like [Dioscorea cayenensis subsp. rotundata]|uniref:RING-type E3 ubiquitin transferase n=1 Tax=Dioscorea cayennensis subsp. rotundata TaxID=55577 RepID=A0AB40AIS2_DIOCR|nr:E3 ubiquitin-protein ligase SIRP1-like [Dioscorea cayenensis subsp. rotundata]XP_039114804.1 E3 ubiquitin-protein ligase SIRP1-like [Dioscorea cayenensis subsp. rotundata]XP_039114805.1 E3 ubiquitin-protein ligase SIRP1-like [Dioscorea cayenensis subsp. rotundata]